MLQRENGNKQFRAIVRGWETDARDNFSYTFQDHGDQHLLPLINNSQF